MRLLHFEVLVQLAVLVAVGSSGTVYVTDLPIYSVLAPCAAEAVSYVVQGLTQRQCPPSVTALESCACTQDSNSVSVASAIASNVLEGCGDTASGDLSSASFVFSAYCNQTAAVTLPTGGPVTQYITDLPAFSDLGQCAADAVSYAVQGLTANKCPGAVSLLASCACTKDQISLAVSEAINSNVIENCGSTHSADFTSAQAVFAGYCGMEAGTTSFPSPSYLPGDVTYYITDLPTYSSLATCAQEAISYPVFELANKDCPSAPLALVACACVKDQNSQVLSSQIASQIRENCGSTASDDITSALGVFAYYCSAGQGLVTPAGVTASVTTTPYRTGAGYTYSYGPTATNTNTGPLIQLPGTTSQIPLGAIIGASIGAVIFIIFMLSVGWRYRLRHRPRFSPPPAELHSETRNLNAFDKAELPGASVGKRLSKPIVRKPTPSVAVSPVSPMENESAVLAGRAEMEAQNRSEVPAGPNAQELHPEQARYEVQGQLSAQESVNAPRYEVPGSHQHPVETAAPGVPRANMNEGPFYELEGPYR